MEGVGIEPHALLATTLLYYRLAGPFLCSGNIASSLILLSVCLSSGITNRILAVPSIYGLHQTFSG
jgi:hypothetical protein